MGHWEARATYEDGFEIDKEFPYPLNNESDNEQQYYLEAWLMNIHKGITWYSVNFVAE